jgi:hypothetical protein
MARRTKPAVETQAGGEWPKNEGEVELPPRREILIDAIRRVRAALAEETPPSRGTIGNLVQLLKLHKELGAEEIPPAEIRLIWNDIEDEEMSSSDG